MFAGSAFGLIAGTAFTSFVVYACVSDLRTRRIPNELVLLLAITGLAYSTGIGTLSQGLLRGVAGLLTGLLIWLPFWLLGWLGAGDVKFFAGAAAWLGPSGALEAGAIGAVIGAVLTVAWLGWERGVRVAVEKSLIAMIHPRILTSASVNSRDSHSLVPYGIALAAGVLVVSWFPALLHF